MRAGQTGNCRSWGQCVTVAPRKSVLPAVRMVAPVVRRVPGRLGTSSGRGSRGRECARLAENEDLPAVKYLGMFEALSGLRGKRETVRGASPRTPELAVLAPSIQRCAGSFCPLFLAPSVENCMSRSSLTGWKVWCHPVVRRHLSSYTTLSSICRTIEGGCSACVSARPVPGCASPEGV